MIGLRPWVAGLEVRLKSEADLKIFPKIPSLPKLPEAIPQLS